MHLGQLLERSATLYPSKKAMICHSGRFTYREVRERVLRLCNLLRKNGIGPKRSVAIISYNCHRFFEAYFSCAIVGAFLVPINFRLSPQEVHFILKDAEVSLLISHFDFEHLLSDWIRNEGKNVPVFWIDPPSDDYQSYERAISGESSIYDEKWGPGDDLTAQIYYTSGTTGRPKGVMLSHKNCYIHALSAIAELKLTDEDVWLHVAPMFHLADAWATWAVTWVGGTHVMVKRFDPKEVLETIEKEKVTITNMIPTMLNLLVKHPDFRKFDYSSLRVMLSGGAPIAPELVRMIMEGFGCDYIQTYGMTETSPYLTVSILKDHLKKLPPEEQFTFKAKTGRPFLCIDLKVVRDDGKEVEPDGKEVGEIIVKGDSVMSGYWKLPEETQKTLKDGWLYTGDLATIDKEGYVNIVDRKKDMIITGGENVYSTEVEAVLYENPKVLEAAVFGLPDEVWGEIVCAAVVLKPETYANEQELIDFCKERLARYKAPKKIFFLDELPKTGSGKIAKRILREQFKSEK
ncbi:MAG: long-chain-fatty-acid--CoA ligase [Desulfobacterota bacterium]|nr:long-chain-fatty-acid--CoA ligase [Thermodesulfobacteriota bacterium]MDW8001903.1 long-chain-fatty-acid--CoA ligase [Deltaproteobacteria bacterium]